MVSNLHGVIFQKASFRGLRICGNVLLHFPWDLKEAEAEAEEGNFAHDATGVRLSEKLMNSGTKGKLDRGHEKAEWNSMNAKC